jgi:ParB family transcriptional regulator, chromosome partitioning protein
MSDKKRGLGRGFDSLIPTEIVEAEFDPTAKTGDGGQKVSPDQVIEVGVDLVDPNPHQPRQVFDESQLRSLSDSISVHGILQPLVVTQAGGRYELIAGERRLRAAKLAGLETVPVIVRSFGEQQKLELALIENLQRAELNPIETATAYRKLIDQFNVNQEDIARRVGRDASTVANTLRLLGLPIEAKRAVVSGQITEGHARQILAVKGLEKQLALLDLIIKNGWTVRQAETFARDFKRTQVTKERALSRTASTNPMTEDLGRWLGTKVSLQRTAKGGKLLIEYYSEEELKRIYEAIKAQNLESGS